MSPKSRVRKKEPAARLSVAQSRELQIGSYRRRLVIRVGVVLMVGAAVLALVHAADHFGAFGSAQPSGTSDLLFGWPMAAVIFLIGAVMAGQNATPGRGK
jgi:hypothetical protein